MKMSKVVGAIVGVLFFIAVIGGLTYAYTIWTSQNINRKVSSDCFEILYDKGNDLSGAIIPSFDYTGGLHTTVRINLSSECNVNANGFLYLNTETGTSSNLFREGLLNYQVVRNESTFLSSGNITSNGEIKIDLGSLAKTENAFTRYDVYVWLDYNLIENSDVNSVYYGDIRAEAVQFNNK